MPKETKRDQDAKRILQELPIIEENEVNPSDGGNWGKGFRTPLEAGRYLSYIKQKNFIQNTKDYLHLVKMSNGIYRLRVIPRLSGRKSRARKRINTKDAIDG
jgi:hypothetical protein